MSNRSSHSSNMANNCPTSHHIAQIISVKIEVTRLLLCFLNGQAFACRTHKCIYRIHKHDCVSILKHSMISGGASNAYTWYYCPRSNYRVMVLSPRRCDEEPCPSEKRRNSVFLKGIGATDTVASFSFSRCRSRQSPLSFRLWFSLSVSLVHKKRPAVLKQNDFWSRLSKWSSLKSSFSVALSG